MKVSIIVACYNQGMYLPETLDCIIKQGYNDWECIIINDGSNDNTETIAKQYEANDKRFKYMYQDNQGVCIARNNAIKASNGKYIICLDADDLISKEYLQKSVDVLDNNPDVKLVTCNFKYFGLKNKVVFVEEYSLEKLLGHNLYINCSMFRRQDYNIAGGFNLNMNKGYEDWDFWISLLQDGGNVYILDGIHFYYRIKKRSRNTLTRDKDINYLLRKQIWLNHKEVYSKVYPSPIYSNEYIAIEQSYEYKLGVLLLSPIRKVVSFLNNLLLKLR